MQLWNKIFDVFPNQFPNRYVTDFEILGGCISQDNILRIQSNIIIFYVKRNIYKANFEILPICKDLIISQIREQYELELFRTSNHVLLNKIEKIYAMLP